MASSDLPSQAAAVSKDLHRWLPSSWPMNEATATEMIGMSVKALRQGISVMEAIEETDRENEDSHEDGSSAES